LEEEDFIIEVVLQEGSNYKFGSEVYLLSMLISIDEIEKYNVEVVKLGKELELMDFADYLWNLKSYNLNGIPIVKIHYEKCKEFGGIVGDYSKKWSLLT